MTRALYPKATRPRVVVLLLLFDVIIVFLSLFYLQVVRNNEFIKLT